METSTIQTKSGACLQLQSRSCQEHSFREMTAYLYIGSLLPHMLGYWGHLPSQSHLRGRHVLFITPVKVPWSETLGSCLNLGTTSANEVSSFSSTLMIPVRKRIPLFTQTETIHLHLISISNFLPQAIRAFTVTDKKQHHSSFITQSMSELFPTAISAVVLFPPDLSQTSWSELTTYCYSIWRT